MHSTATADERRSATLIAFPRDRAAAVAEGDRNPWFPIEPDRAAVRRCLFSLAILETVVIGFVVLIALVTTAAAFDGTPASGAGGGAPVLAYAEEQNQPGATLFLDMVETEDGHPLNDMLMGVDVHTIDGSIAGYVSDALVGSSGAVEMLVISPAGDGGLVEAVMVPAWYVIVGEDHLSVDMTIKTLAAQPVADETVLASWSE